MVYLQIWIQTMSKVISYETAIADVKLSDNCIQT